MTDEEMLACATEFSLLPYDTRGNRQGLRELKVAFRGPNAWAIVCVGAVLNHDGEWEYESMPSSRTEDFFARCRWPTAREAIDFAQQHVSAHPSGYKGK